MALLTQSRQRPYLSVTPLGESVPTNTTTLTDIESELCPKAVRVAAVVPRRDWPLVMTFVAAVTERPLLVQRDSPEVQEEN